MFLLLALQTFARGALDNLLAPSEPILCLLRETLTKPSEVLRGEFLLRRACFPLTLTARELCVEESFKWSQLRGNTPFAFSNVRDNFVNTQSVRFSVIMFATMIVVHPSATL